MANSTDAYDIIIRHCMKPLKLFPFALKQMWCLYQTLPDPEFQEFFKVIIQRIDACSLQYNFFLRWPTYSLYTFFPLMYLCPH